MSRNIVMLYDAVNQYIGDDYKDRMFQGHVFDGDKFLKWLFTQSNGFTYVGKTRGSNAIKLANLFINVHNNNEIKFLKITIGRNGQRIYKFKRRQN